MTLVAIARVQAGLLSRHFGLGGGFGLGACWLGRARGGHGWVDSGLAQKVAGIVPHPARFGRLPWVNVGASLLAIAVGQIAPMLNVPPSSRAGQTPQGGQRS